MGKKHFSSGSHGVAQQLEKLKLKKQIEYIVPNVYAAFCLTLYDKYNWEPDQIEQLCAETQALWQRSTEEGWNIRDNCEEVTGISVIHSRTFEENGGQNIEE